MQNYIDVLEAKQDLRHEQNVAWGRKMERIIYIGIGIIIALQTVVPIVHTILKDTGVIRSTYSVPNNNQSSLPTDASN